MDWLTKRLVFRDSWCIDENRFRIRSFPNYLKSIFRNWQVLLPASFIGKVCYKFLFYPVKSCSEEDVMQCGTLHTLVITVLFRDIIYLHD